MSDVTERKLFSAKQIWTVVVFVATATTTVTIGYFQLDAKASSAIDGTKVLSSDVQDLSEELQIIKCLIRQQNYHQFYKRIPEWECK